MTEKPGARHQKVLVPGGPPMTDPPILLFEERFQTESFSLYESLHTGGKPSTW